MEDKKIIIALLIILVALIVVGAIVLNPFVSKTETVVNITSSNELRDGGQFTVTLMDVNGTPLADQIVNITFIDANGGKNIQRIVTDTMGNGVFTLNGLASGHYTVNVTYAGSDDYSNSSTSQELTVKEKETQTTQSTQSNDLEKYRTRSDTYLTVTPTGYVLEEDSYGHVISVNGDPSVNRY